MSKKLLTADDLRDLRLRGLGDAVALTLKAPGVRHIVKALTGIDPAEPCDGCKRRQEWLNEKFPLRE